MKLALVAQSMVLIIKGSFFLCRKQLCARWPFVLFLHSLWKWIIKKIHKSLQPSLKQRPGFKRGEKKVNETVGTSPVLHSSSPGSSSKSIRKQSHDFIWPFHSERLGAAGCRQRAALSALHITSVYATNLPAYLRPPN